MKMVKLSALPVELSRKSDRYQAIVAWWAEVACGDMGATSWEVLAAIQDQVTQALTLSPPDIVLAESLTARAMMLTAGLMDP